MKVQVDLDVLGSDNYYNKNIGGKRFFRPVESDKKISGVNNGRYIGPFTITYDNGVEHRIENMTVREFAERHGYDTGNLSSVKTGRRASHKNIVKVEHDKDKDN